VRERRLVDAGLHPPQPHEEVALGALVEAHLREDARLRCRDTEAASTAPGAVTLDESILSGNVPNDCVGC
jgi:hypothetical protein